MVYNLRQLIKQRKNNCSMSLNFRQFFQMNHFNSNARKSNIRRFSARKKISDSFRPVSLHFDHNDPQEKPASFSIISTNFKGSNAVRSNDNT